jgi:hypothetical protein
MDTMFTTMPGSTPASTALVKQTMQLSMYGGVCFGVVLLIWPALVIYFMTRPQVKAAFAVGPQQY